MSDGAAVAVLALVVLLGGVGTASAGVAAGVGEGGDTAVAGVARGTGNAEDAGAAPTEITDCTTITEPGEYVLAGDVANASPETPRSGLGACVAVRASDVVIEGRRHAISASDGGQPGVVGVLVGADHRLSNVTVRNLTTTRWGAGVAVLGVTDATLRNVSAVGNLGDGFFVERAPGVTVRGGVVRGSNTGVFVRAAPDARLADLTVTENLAGVAVRRSDGATVGRLDASRNRLYGVGLFASANATVADSTLRANGFAGVALSRVDDGRLRNLTIAPATTPGEGDPVGIYLNDSSGTRLDNVSVADGPGWAVYTTGDSTTVGERVRLGGSHLSLSIRDVALDPTNGTPPLPIGRRVVGEPLLAVPTGEGARLSLSIHYDDSGSEQVRAAEESLSLWRFDAGDGWERTPTTLDADRNVARVTVENPSRNGTVVALVTEGLSEVETGNETGTTRRPPRPDIPAGSPRPLSSPRCRRTAGGVRR